jgi:hypothetical protein
MVTDEIAHEKSRIPAAGETLYADRLPLPQLELYSSGAKRVAVARSIACLVSGCHGRPIILGIVCAAGGHRALEDLSNMRSLQPLA